MASALLCAPSLKVDVGDVAPHRARAEEGSVGDLVVALPAGQEDQHLQHARREAIRAARKREGAVRMGAAAGTAPLPSRDRGRIMRRAGPGRRHRRAGGPRRGATDGGGT